jgi:hypothetical protein
MLPMVNGLKVSSIGKRKVSSIGKTTPKGKLYWEMKW